MVLKENSVLITYKRRYRDNTNPSTLKQGSMSSLSVTKTYIPTDSEGTFSKYVFFKILEVVQNLFYTCRREKKIKKLIDLN